MRSGWLSRLHGWISILPCCSGARHSSCRMWLGALQRLSSLPHPIANSTFRRFFRASSCHQSNSSPLASPPPSLFASPPSTVRYAAPMSVVPMAGKGRGVIATQPIARGDTVLVEQPIASLLVSAVPLVRPFVNTEQPHCSYCLAQLPTGTSHLCSSCSGCDAVYCNDEHKRLHSLSHHDIMCGYFPPSSTPSLLDIDPVLPVPVKFPIMASHLLASTLIQMLLPAAPTASPRLWDDLGRLCHVELDSALLTVDYHSVIEHLSLSLQRHPLLNNTKLDVPTLSALLPLSLYSRLVALLHLNCHSIYSSPDAHSTLATALFVQGAFFNHSCSPNVELQQPLREAEAGSGGQQRRACGCVVGESRCWCG